MAFSNGYIVGFATAVCVVASLGVASTATGLKPTIDANKEADLQYNILGALGFADPAVKPSVKEINDLWAKHVEVQYITPEGDVVSTDDMNYDLTNDGVVNAADVDLAWKQARKGEVPAPKVMAIYRGSADGELKNYALGLNGVGLWGPISGYLAIDPRGETIQGVTFFAPKETPGLGAEIMSPSFKQQWVGKSIVENGEPSPITVAKGEATSDDKVDGVSGATLTCNGVTDMMVNGFEYYTPFLNSLRQ